MVDTLGLQDLFLGTLSGAAIVLCGAFFALFFALAKLHKSHALMLASTISYLALAASVYVLIISLKLEGFWIGVTVVMLGGYLIAPYVIWRLCIGTHAQAGHEENAELQS